MSRYIVDASVAVKWVVQEEGSEEAYSLVGHELAAPSLWLAECANVLWTKARRRELTVEEARDRQQLLLATPLVLVSLENLIERATELAWALDVTVYDATYLALALDLDAPLVTADAKLLVRCQARSGAPPVLLLSDLG